MEEVVFLIATFSVPLSACTYTYTYMYLCEDRVGLMLDAICRQCQDTEAFCAVVWNILFCSSSARPSATSYILLHVTKSTSMAKVFQGKDESTVSLMVRLYVFVFLFVRCEVWLHLL